MTQPAAPPPNPPRRGAVRWRSTDLEPFAMRWGTSAAVVRAAMLHANVTDYPNPDAARKAVEEFLKLDARALEKAQDDKLRAEKH